MLSDSDTSVLAVCVLAALALALAAWGWKSHRRTKYTLAQSALYAYVRIMVRVAWRAEISGPLPVPDGQGAVIICNHSSGMDPGIIALATNRAVHWLTAREFYEMPLIHWFCKAMGAIPVNRGGIDTASTKLAIRYAQAGELVGLFPEGRINDTGRLLLPGRPGAALIALKARVPVVPCYVRGAPFGKTVIGPLFMAAHATLVVGKPIDLSEYYERAGEDGILGEMTKRFLTEIARLAGVEDYEPELAGRRWKPGMEQAAPAELSPAVSSPRPPAAI